MAGIDFFWANFSLRLNNRDYSMQYTKLLLPDFWHFYFESLLVGKVPKSMSYIVLVQ